MIPGRRDVDLSFAGQAAKRFAVQNAIPVPLKFRAQRAFFLRSFPHSLAALGGPWRQTLILTLLCLFPCYFQLTIASQPYFYSAFGGQNPARQKTCNSWTLAV
jgi:hypothetical protein